jgi:hypothetical protein
LSDWITVVLRQRFFSALEALGVLRFIDLSNDFFQPPNLPRSVF